MPTQPGGRPCPVFPADNIWNRNISALPTSVRSNAYINSIGVNSHVHADFGSGLWDGGPIGIPFVVVPGSQPFVPINFTEYGDQSDPGPYPVPTNAPIEGGPTAGGDRHVLVIDQRQLHPLRDVQLLSAAQRLVERGERRGVQPQLQRFAPRHLDLSRCGGPAHLSRPGDAMTRSRAA